VLSTNEFVEWSKKVVLFVHNTSKVDDEPYPELLFQMGGIGFPTMSYLDADGRLLQQVGHVTPVSELEAAFQQLQGWQALRQEIEKGGAGAAKEKELFLLELRMGNRPYDEMEQRRDRLSLGEQERKDTEQPLVNLQYTEILRATPRDQQAKGGALLLPMFRAGRIPTTTTETSYWQYLFAHAAAQQDVPLFKELLAWVKEHRAGDKRLQRYLPQLEEQLRQLEQQRGGGK
jgi:hypothetical protein